MKRITFLFIFILLKVHIGFSQKDDFYTIDSNGDIQLLNTNESKFKFVLNNEFSRLITGGAINGIGNYVSVGTGNNVFSAAVNVVKKTGILAIDVAGGTSGGVVSLFENDNFNPNFNLGVSYHFMIGSQDITINYGDFQRVERKHKELISKKETEQAKVEAYKIAFKKQLNAKNGALSKVNTFLKTNVFDPKKDAIYQKHLAVVKSEIETLQRQKKYYSENLDVVIEKLRGIRDNRANTDIFKYDKFKIDSLKAVAFEYNFNKQIKEKEAEKREIKGIINSNNYDAEKEKEYLAQQKLLQKEITVIKNKIKDYDANLASIKGFIRNDVDDEIYANVKKANNVKATDVGLSWITLGGNIAYQKFDLFDQTRPIGDQVFSEEDLVPTFSVAISRYTNKAIQNSFKIDAKRVQYYSLGVQLNYGNNASALKSRILRTEETLSNGRTLISDRNVLLGAFVKNKISGLLYADYYRFIGSRNNIGLHLRGTIDMGEFKPVTSVRVGALFPLINKDNQNSYLNLELFYGLKDIFNQATENSLFDRNIIGIQATVPFNFKIF